MKAGLRYSVAEHIGGALLDGLMHSVRFDIHNADMHLRYARTGQPVIYTTWHGRLLPLGYVHRNQGIVGLASRSADGEYIARILQRWGFHLVRGSSSSGGDVALRELIRTIRGGKCVAITPDGPRGPREQVKLGVVQLAQMTGAPIVPLVAAAARAWWFVSWDHFLVPKPFARVSVDYAEPILVPRDATAAQLEDSRARVEQSLGELLRRVDSRVAA